MLKLAGLLLLFSSSVLTGFYAAAALHDREQSVNRQLSFWQQFSLQLECLQSPPAQLVHMLAAQREFAGDGFYRLLDDSFKSGGSFKAALGKALTALSITKDREICEILLPLGDVIGVRDIESQTAAIASVVMRLTDRRDRVRKEAAQKGGLYQRLGILGGLLLAVLFW